LGDDLDGRPVNSLTPAPVDVKKEEKKKKKTFIEKYYGQEVAPVHIHKLVTSHIGYF
jgi:hypothetical protein